jgi:hypothetical protein
MALHARRPFSVLVLPLLLVALACGGDDEGADPPAGGHYENATVRYEFDYPEAWADISGEVELGFEEGGEQPELLDNVAVGELDEIGLLHGVHVTVVRVSDEVTEATIGAELAAVDALYERLAAQAAGRVVETRDVELGGLPARQYVLEYVFAGQAQAASAFTVTFFGDRQYTVNCQGRADSFDVDVLPGCEQVLQSFRFR